MTRMSRFSLLTAAVAGLYLGGVMAAFSQQIAAPEKKVAVVAQSVKRPLARSSSGPKVYLLRGLMNIFSLGMDDLARKLEARGISTYVGNHAEWQSLSDEIAARYKAGNRSPIVLVGHSLGADAVMYMGEYLGTKGVPVALIVPFDGTGSFAASANVARVMNITQRDYAKMRRGPGFRGELANIDVSSYGVSHTDIDKSARLHTMVINKIVSVLGRGRAAPTEMSKKPAENAAVHAAAPEKKEAQPATPQ